MFISVALIWLLATCGQPQGEKLPPPRDDPKPEQKCSTGG